MNFQKLLKDDPDNIDICIKSILPDEIPKREDKKRDVLQLLSTNPQIYHEESTEESQLDVKKVEKKTIWRDSIEIYGQKWRNI